MRREFDNWAPQEKLGAEIKFCQQNETDFSKSFKAINLPYTFSSNSMHKALMKKVCVQLAFSLAQLLRFEAN